MSVLENIMFAPVEHKLMTREEAQKVGMELLEKLDSQIKPMPIQTAFPVVKTTWLSHVDLPWIQILCSLTNLLLPLTLRWLEMYWTLWKNWQSKGMTMIIVTHEMGFARQVANRVIFTADGEFLEEVNQTKSSITHNTHV